MLNTVKAGFVYFALVFAVGFVLGTIRVLVLAQRVGELGAVVIEIPIMLLASWMICCWLIRHLQVSRDLSARITMGVAAFAFLMIAELALSVWIFDNPVAAHFANYTTAHGGLGLAGQVAFAAFPVIQLRRRK